MKASTRFHIGAGVIGIYEDRIAEGMNSMRHVWTVKQDSLYFTTVKYKEYPYVWSIDER